VSHNKQRSQETRNEKKDLRDVFQISFLVSLISFLPFAVQAAPWTGIIDPSRAMDWSQPGVKGGIIDRTTICATLNPGVTAAQINSAISSCNNGVVFLSAGTFNLSSAIDFGSKSNVTLRGAGADKTFLVFSGGSGCGAESAVICSSSGGIGMSSPQNSTTWTAGYAPGTSVITVGSSSGMKVGGMIVVDQLDDSAVTGNIFVCSSSACTDEGGNSFGRANRSQQQVLKVVAIAGNQVTVEPPIRMPNWRASQNPGVVWNGGGPIITGIGVEYLSLDSTNAGGVSTGIMFVHISDSWVKGIRSLNTNVSHVWLFRGMRNTVRDSYFYGTQNAATQSYGVQMIGTGGNLVENNIAQHVTGPFKHNGSDTGSVVAYNFSIDDTYTPDAGWEIPTLAYHEAGVGLILHEGNDGLGELHDNIHGTVNLNTSFRNHLYGDIWNNPAKTANTEIMNIAAFGRFFNVVGNVMGRTGFYTTYEANLTDNPKAIYSLGYPRGPLSDGLVKTTMFRWGNYDTVTGAVRWDPTEVPSSLNSYSNAVPASQTLPPSLYLTAKPAFFGSIPWPPIGPDVTGGNITGYGGHANKIPARVCYETTPKTNGILNFNPDTCYASIGIFTRCDVNTDGTTNVSDVQLSVNQAVGAATCNTADINNDASCNVVDVQRVVNAALGGQCVTQ
jgi:hypothetical protein